MQNVHNQM